MTFQKLSSINHVTKPWRTDSFKEILLIFLFEKERGVDWVLQDLN